MSRRSVNLSTVEISEKCTVGNLFSSGFRVVTMEFSEPNVLCHYLLQKFQHFKSNYCANRAAVCSR